MNTTLLARTCLALSPIGQVCPFPSDLRWISAWRLDSCSQCRAFSSIQRRKTAADLHIELEIPQMTSMKSPRH
jgi:hypothetical protein